MVSRRNVQRLPRGAVDLASLALPAREMELLNEVLNNDMVSLRKVISIYNFSNKLDQMDTLGLMGENALHIAIYKRDIGLTEILLNEGKCSPNVKSKRWPNDDNPVHIAARLGFAEGLKLLYATGKCNLNLLNTERQTAYDIAVQNVNDFELDLTRLYCNWDGVVTLDEERITITEGRKECAVFLKEKVEIDNENTRQTIYKNMIGENTSRNKLIGMLRNTGYANERIFDSTYVNYIKSNKQNNINEDDVAVVIEIEPSVAVVPVFCDDFVSRNMKSAFQAASHHHTSQGRSRASEGDEKLTPHLQEYIRTSQQP